MLLAYSCGIFKVWRYDKERAGEYHRKKWGGQSAGVQMSYCKSLFADLFTYV